MPFKSLFLWILASFSLVAFAENRPNILFILVDDMRFDAMGCAGNSQVRTPTIDRLAANGIRFTNAFCTTPICAASRASIFTGLYEKHHRYTFGTAPLAKDLTVSSYPSLLRQNGYFTGFVDKMGINYEGNLYTLLFDFYRQPLEKDYPHYFRGYDKKTGRFRTLLDDMEKYALQCIDSAKNNPLYLSIHFHEPHAIDQDPYQYPHPIEYDTLFQYIKINNMPLSEPKWFEMQPDWVKNGENRNRWNWRFDTPQKYQTMVKRYYRMIYGVDQVVANVLSKLEATGKIDNTIVVFMSDNGYFLGDRGLADKWLMYEPSLRIPFIYCDPKIKPKGETRHQIALNIDIMPTLLEAAGIKCPSAIDGTSLYPILKSKDAKIRSHFFAEHCFNTKIIPKSECIRTPEYKYFRYIDHPEWEEFYSLKEDPWEMHNKVADPQYQQVVNDLRNKLNLRK